jgi:hypothetical protein
MLTVDSSGRGLLTVRPCISEMIFTRILTSAFTNRRLSKVQDLHATVLVIDFNDFSKKSELTFDIYDYIIFK